MGRPLVHVVTVNEHTCSECGMTLAAKYFTKDKRTKTGLYGKCRKCVTRRVTPKTQICRMCKEELPASEFYMDKKRQQGIGASCKKCNPRGRIGKDRIKLLANERVRDAKRREDPVNIQKKRDDSSTRYKTNAIIQTEKNKEVRKSIARDMIKGGSPERMAEVRASRGMSSQQKIKTNKTLVKYILDLTEDLSVCADVCFEMLTKEMDNKEDRVDRRFAIEWFSNRGIGKPITEVVNNTGINITIGLPTPSTEEEPFIEVKPE